ncbi:ankyrin repeat-containing domain protein [Aspergillus lucknowensis]|uniref:Ankyrin repeat-containing domain protein n=1 Tax=Aspergillus lucknowensis TaxID=176173 RepID=A0ABR4LDU3_9EURO
MDDSVWESYKPELHRLYIRQNMKLREVMDYMTSKYAFEATQRQYLSHFTRWGFQKNTKISPADGQFIGRRIAKRKQLFDKESEVHVNGVEYAPRKVRKAPYGKAYVTTFDGVRVPGAPSPDTPEGISVCTPVTPGVRLMWNTSLPWLRFSRFLQPGQSEDLPSPVARLAVTSPQDPNAVSYTVNRELLERLSSLVPWDRLSHPVNINSSSRTATGLSILMPEATEDYHRDLAARFCESKQSTVDTFGVEMFLLSNNLISHGPKGKSPETMEAHDRRVLEMFRRSGWNNVTQLRALLSTNEPSAAAIAEQLFGSALREMNEDIVEMLLAAGTNSNCPIDTVDYGPITPLQFVSSLPWGFDADIANLLLSNGADVDICYNGTSPLEYAVTNRNTEAIEMFLSIHARVSPSCLAAAAADISDPKLFSRFLGPDTDVNARDGVQGQSPLAESVRCGSINIIKLLLSRGADINALVDIPFCNDWGVTSVLGLAVESGNPAVIDTLLDASQDVNPALDGLPYISPLALAVACKRPNRTVIERLLSAGVAVQVADTSGERTLIELALTHKNEGICDILVRHGAMIERPESRDKQPTSALLCAIQNGATGFASALIRMGVRLNDVYEDFPGTVLGAAIEKGYLPLICMLQAAGATAIHGTRVTQIGNMETAAYLEHSGVLQQILRTSGAQVLGAAIAAEKYDLARRLVYLDLDFNHPILEQGETGSGISPTSPLRAAIMKRQFSLAYVILDRGVKVTDGDLEKAVEYTADEEAGDELLSRLLVAFRGNAPSAITEAILQQRTDLVQLLLTSGVDPVGKPPGVWELDDDSEFVLEPPESVLEISSRYNDRQLLRILLQSRRWEPRLTGRALGVAIFFRHTDLVDDYLRAPIDLNQDLTITYPDTEDENGTEAPGYRDVVSPLQLAAKRQDISVTKLLLEHREVDVNHLGPGIRRRTPLQHAVDSGNMELVNLLLSHKTSVNAGPASDGGATALQIATIRGYIGIARRLIDLNADVNAPAARYNGRTALEGAAEHGRIDMLQLLLDEGASVTGEFGQRQYQRSIELAEKNGHNAAARLLMAFEPRSA